MGGEAVAIVLAGGSGSRMGRPKQFIDLLGHPALYYTLRAFDRAPGIRRIHVVGEQNRIEELVREAGIRKYAGCAPPGESRSLSTKSGLGRCGEDPETVALIHDGSRCLVTPELIQRVVEASTDGVDGVIPALPVSDTIKVTESGTVRKTLDRSELHSVQTPQAFRLGLLRRIYTASDELLHTATDDSSLIERDGGSVVLVMGEKTNLKLTSPEDLILAEAILEARSGNRHGVRL